MDERAALALVADHVAGAGDDAAVVDDLVVTTDMLHETTDFPAGTTRYTAGWRAVAASLSDVAAMGATAMAAVAVYGAPSFDADELEAFLAGATEACEAVGAEYVGGDLDAHDEFTVTTTAIGRTERPVHRRGATPGDRVVVTGALGRSAAAMEHFAAGEAERANELFRFTPRIAAGRALAPHATAMLDSSDGLARSTHQLADASEVGIRLDGSAIPVAASLREVEPDRSSALERAVTFGEDFELLATLPADALDEVRETCPDPVTVVGEVTDGDGVSLDGIPLADRGYTHGG